MLSDTDIRVIKMEQRLLKRIEVKKGQLDQLRPIPQAILEKLREEVFLNWIYNSNAIEGSTITLQETRLILETGLTVGGKSLREHFEVINHKEAIRYVEDLVQSTVAISAFHVRQIHKLILTNVDDENAGSYRQTQVRIAGSEMMPPEAWRVEGLMDDWSQWVSANAEEMHPVVFAALAHHRLVSIHPFIDGNGRTARLVMNLLLMKKGYPPTIILRTNRRKYYTVLALADDGKPEALVNFAGRAVEQSLDLYLEACKPSTRPSDHDDEWILLKEACVGTPYSQEYISLLARLGRIEAVKKGRYWYTTRKAIKDYQASL